MACQMPEKTMPPTVASAPFVNNAIATERLHPADTPIAFYTKKIPNDLNNWVFSVKVFETKATFSYKVAMQFEEIRGIDTITVPNLGISPKIYLQPENSQKSVILGFIDNKGVKRPFKKITAANDQLKITTIKYYGVRTTHQ